MSRPGLADAHQLGTSMGSVTSFDFALNYPERVRSWTLLGNSSGPRDEAEREHYRQNWDTKEMRLREVRGEGAVAVFEEDPAYQSLQKDDPTGWSVHATNLRGQSVEGAVHVLSTFHWNRRSLFDDMERLRFFARTVMLVPGHDDYYLVRETSVFLVNTLANARWHRFPVTGHLANIERTAEFNRLLLDFFGN